MIDCCEEIERTTWAITTQIKGFWKQSPSVSSLSVSFIIFHSCLRTSENHGGLVKFVIHWFPSPAERFREFLALQNSGTPVERPLPNCHAGELPSPVSFSFLHLFLVFHVLVPEAFACCWDEGINAKILACCCARARARAQRVRACVRACVRVCVCMCACMWFSNTRHICLLWQ